ncbi:MAG: glycosyltransferase family protein, partial [Acidimicrobiia bacterium]
MAEAESLRLAGHEVVGVSRDGDDDDWVLQPSRPGLLGRLTGRSSTGDLAEVAAGLKGDIYQPTHPTGTDSATTAARSTPGSAVLVKPGWPRPMESDLIALAPSDPARSVPSLGAKPYLHIPGYRRPHLRHEPGGEMVIAYRRTATNPGRYLEAALARSGMGVRRVEEIDWDTIGPNNRGVIVVESPLPALRVRGSNPGVPVLFWVHHGEHHVDANTRLQRRYGAHAVLLAHSWHLSHRFLGLVERLPFGVAPELFRGDFKAHNQRRWDSGFVGASSPDRYGRRVEILAKLQAHLGEERVKTATGVPPEEMADIYEGSRLVIDDGAARHLPITMRVFEATGAGAALLAKPGPGLELLFEPGSEFATMGEDPVAQALALLENDTEPMGQSGHRRAWSDHTYDIRVSELVDVLDRVDNSGISAPEPMSRAGLAAVVDRFCDAQRILDLGGEVAPNLPGREVWSYREAEEKAEPASFHLSVIAGGEEAQRRRAVASARLAVAGTTSEADRLAAV